MLELKIAEVANGYIIFHESEIDDGRFETMKEVIEETGDEREAMARLLVRVADYFGIHYDRYGEENLNITWDKKGHKIS